MAGNPELPRHRGVLITIGTVLCMTLAGCGSAAAGGEAAPTSSPVPTSATSASSSGAPTPGASVSRVGITVAIAGGQVSPPASRIDIPVGSMVYLVVTSDVADEVHVHGYDIEKPVAAGGSVTFRFTADQTGVFEVETHETDKLLLKLASS